MSQIKLEHKAYGVKLGHHDLGLAHVILSQHRNGDSLGCPLIDGLESLCDTEPSGCRRRETVPKLAFFHVDIR